MLVCDQMAGSLVFPCKGPVYGNNIDLDVAGDEFIKNKARCSGEYSD
jgi:hypothetical protein